MLEESGFYAMVAGQPDSNARTRLAGLVTTLRALEIGDDTTLMMLETQSMPAEQLMDFQFNSCATNLQGVRQLVRDAVLQAGCDEELTSRLVLVVDEAIANVIRHGYCDDECGDIRLTIPQEGDLLLFMLRDYAEPVDGASIKPRDLDECRPGGLGVNFIDSVMDSWEFQRPPEGEGNILRMTKRIERGTS
jgi:sigma-B regulation protein RsbU (phosphoserine phosphatase)